MIPDDLFAATVFLIAGGIILTRLIDKIDYRTLLVPALTFIAILYVIIMLWMYARELYYNDRSIAIANTMFRVLLVGIFTYLLFEIFSTKTTLRETLIVQVSVLFLISTYFTIVTHTRILALRKRRREKAEKETQKINEISEFLDFKINDASIQELKRKLDVFNEYRIATECSKQYLAQLRARRRNIIRTIITREHEEEVDALKKEKERLMDSVQQLTQEKQMAQESEEEKAQRRLEELNMEDCNVFVKEDLESSDVLMLLQQGYQQTNEYCAYQQKMLTVLVKPVMQHSNTHTFLVWSARQIIEGIIDTNNAQVHETRDADITFSIEKKKYAVEIETGTLLRKKQQLQEKIAHLNRKYPNRWLIIVSHKKLAPKYRRFGPVATRKEANQKIHELIDLKAHPKKAGAKRDNTDEK